MREISQFFSELKRRNVFRAGAAYLVLSWLILQVADVLFESFFAPGWAMQVLIGALVVGLPIALLLSWIYDLTAEGLERTDQEAAKSALSGRKLDFVIIGILFAGLALLVFDRTRNPQNVGPIAVIGDTDAASTGRSSLFSPRTVAVVPFVDLSIGKDQERLGDTIAIEMQTALSKRSDLRMLSRSISFDIPDDLQSSKEIGEFLKVDILVEGTVRRLGNRIRVTAQLVSVADGIQLWSDVYETILGDNFGAEVAASEFFSQQVRAQLAAPFTPQVQFDFAESNLSQLFITPASASAQYEDEPSSPEGQRDEE